MRDFRRLRPLMLGLLVLAGSTPAVAAALAAPKQQPARVWFLRPSSAASEILGADPAIYADGAPIGTIPANSDFYRNFAPGSYSFTVQAYGIPTGQADTLRLAPGSQTYIEVQWAPLWEEGYPEMGRGYDSHSFFLFNMTPQLARAYLQGLTALGPA